MITVPYQYQLLTVNYDLVNDTIDKKIYLFF